MREAIFSALESWELVRGARVLDLYAGSGALGLEAASRGARTVALVEKHAAAAQITTQNVRVVERAFAAGDAPEISVVRQSVQTYLDDAGARGARAAWDVALLDPPYDLREEELTANLTALLPLLAPDAVVLVERSSRSPEPRLPDGLVPLREKRYGETALWWSEPDPA